MLEQCRLRRTAVHVTGARPPQRPGEQDRIRGLIELDAVPVPHSVDPLVLDPVSVGLLGGDEIGESTAGRAMRPEGNESARRFDEVARPDEVVPAEVVAGIAPRDRQAGDGGARRSPILMRPQDGRRSQVQVLQVLGDVVGRPRARVREPLPVGDVGVPCDIEMSGHGGRRLERCLLRPAPEANGDLDRVIAGQKLDHPGDVAPSGRFVGPGHRAVRGEVLPAIRRTDVADTLSGRPGIGDEREGGLAVAGEEDRSALVRPGPGPVVETAEAKVWCQQRIETQGMAGTAGIVRVTSVREGRLDADDVRVVIGADPEFQLVAGMAMGRDDRRDARLHRPNVGDRVAFDLAPEPGAVRDDESEVADLRSVHPRPVDLVENAMSDREPHPAGVVRCADGVLRAARPRWGDTGTAGRSLDGLVGLHRAVGERRRSVEGDVLGHSPSVRAPLAGCILAGRLPIRDGSPC